MPKDKAVRPLPKSLHTITVIVNLAHHLHTQTEGEESALDYVSQALRILGYDDAATIHPTGHPACDPHALAYLALSKFRKEIGA
jgi:hypothetical protein